jgi:protein-L-isoaspartate(D-aspartate) O-methyltransferase
VSTISTEPLQSLASQRSIMVKSQLQTVGINDEALLQAFAETPREAHLPPALQGLAYADAALEVAPGRLLLSPMALGLLLHHARPRAGEAVLLVGAATGYSAALLARLGARVTALESDAALLPLLRVSAPSADVREAPLAAGCPEAGPFDLILFEGAIEQVPQAFSAQLKPGGRVAAILRDAGVGQLRVGPLVEGRIVTPSLGEVAAPLLPGFARARAFAF